MKFLSSLNKKNLSGKTCLLRVDFNIEDELCKELTNKCMPLRLRAIFPTIKFLIDNKAKILILSHRGRHKDICAEKNDVLRKEKFSLELFVGVIAKETNQKIQFIDFDSIHPSDVFFGKIKKSINDSSSNIFILENLRFSPYEEEDNNNFAKRLASLGDIYINDAFSVSHRNNASVTAIVKFIPSYAGLLLEKEIKILSETIKKLKKPFIVILGGAKISDKLGLIKNFFDKADYFLIGGGIANTFMAAQDFPIGDSLYEKDMVLVAKKFLKSKKIILPSDVIINERKILDIGPETIKKYSDLIKEAKMIIWNGPLGYFEDERFAKGSKAIAKAILKSKGRAIIGGGETTSLFNLKLKTHNLKPNIFLSTGGGAMLEFLGGKKLPGIKVLNDF